MQDALASVDGVDSVEVDYDNKTAMVTCSTGCDPNDLVAALEGAGYGGATKN